MKSVCQDHEQCFNKYKFIDLICGEISGSKKSFCAKFNCEDDYDCPNGTFCQGNSKEKFCSGKPTSKNEYLFETSVMISYFYTAIHCETNSDCRKTETQSAGENSVSCILKYNFVST